MTTLTLNPVKQDGISAGQPKPTRSPSAADQSKALAEPSAPAAQDSVTLSASAQPIPKAAPSSVLTDSEADATALSLRQQLGSQGLSVTAKQNQAIVALLRR